MNDVVVLGVGMTRFVGKTDVPMREQNYRAGKAAMADAGITFRQVDAVYIANIFEGPMTGVGYIKDFGLTGVPVQRIENASATGSAAFREAYQSIKGGLSEIAMVIGYEDMERITSDHSADSAEGAILPAAFFAMWAKERMQQYGTTVETFAKIAAKNWNNARLNPMAQRQSAELITPEKVLASSMVSDPMTSMMAAAVGQGAAAAILTTPEIARRLRPGRPLVKVTASVIETERYTPHHIFVGPIVGPASMTRSAAQAAYEMAGIGPDDLSMVQVHDAFPIEELMYYELLGFCDDGDGDRMVQNGETELGGRIPFSTDGGLIGRGHPGGPTGLAQIWETVLQLRGEAGPRQIENARAGLCHMVGGGSIAVTHILERC